MKEEPMKKSVQITLGVLAAAIVAVALVFGVKALLPKGDSGEKSISIQVVVSEEDVREFTVNTAEEFLGPALENEGLIEGENSEYGLFVTTVDGVKADDSQNQWWCVTKGGEDVYTGVDTTPIADGDCFELTLSVY